MTNNQWDDLKAFISGEKIDYIPTGFIIDSPWLPGWNGIRTIEYYSSDKQWWETNIKALKLFPDTWFIPGFWSEYGMCTEPSAFGARMVWSETNLPHAEKVLNNIEELDKLVKPDVKTDGLLPFIIGRLQTFEPEIIDAGHNIRFAITRGPHNIASFLLGTTEFMLAQMMNPEKTHSLLRQITDFIISWLKYQIKCFPSIEGLLVLDDIIGFVGEHEFRDFVLPYIKEIFDVGKLPVRCLHNDANGLITAAHLQEMNVNIFNFSFEHSNREIFELAGEEVTLLGNIPPRDVMSQGTPDDVRAWIKREYNNTPEAARVIWSVGGGMAPGTKTENIRAFISEIESLGK
ncbi:MAG: uroporphyrinogen decarboxylase family protein [Marinilabiliaceae bacterium]|jgi:uroporphyrinogen decarboxylase|nr:uroporphyrinogen decarboxylase family protein [Marinilabiliaceae bacterium]